MNTLIPTTIPNPLLEELALLFESMDRAYRLCADRYGFVCNGCDNNCCRSRFFHHTLLEYSYIRQGLDQLPADLRRRVDQRARDALSLTDRAADGGRPRRTMCPLNEGGRCVLYAHRPMICRLHGIPHILRRPDGRHQTGPGCDDFVRRCGNSPNDRLDRTPLYARMALLEQRARRQMGFNEKIKMSIAQIIAGRFPHPVPPQTRARSVT
jgi:Fe-S-cluster containining protein